MLFVLKNLVHLAVFVQEKQEAKNFSAIRYVILNRLGSGHRQDLLLPLDQMILDKFLT